MHYAFWNSVTMSKTHATYDFIKYYPIFLTYLCICVHIFLYVCESFRNIQNPTLYTLGSWLGVMTWWPGPTDFGGMKTTWATWIFECSLFCLLPYCAWRFSPLLCVEHFHYPTHHMELPLYSYSCLYLQSGWVWSQDQATVSHLHEKKCNRTIQPIESQDRMSSSFQKL